MNTKFYNIYGVVSIFPIWIFKSNLAITDLFNLSILFIVLPILAHQLILRLNIKTYSSVIYIWISLITFYSIDQNLGLWIFSQDFTFIYTFTPYYRSIYFSIVIIIFLSLFIFSLKQNGLKILFSFLITIFIFNIIENSKNFSNFPTTDLSFKKQEVREDNINKKIVLIFDEMSGLNSLDSKIKNGEYINKHIINFFLKNKFDIYTNAFSLFKSTDQSLSSVLNFITNKQSYTNIDIEKKTHFLKKSKNYFIVKDLIENKFFDLENNKNIVVQQSMYMNFCDHPKVIICNQFNPFNKNLTFLDGFKDTKLTNYVSNYRNNGSVLSHLIWRILVEIRAIDTRLDPAGEKASIRYLFNELFENIKNNKTSTLFFSHILIPHIPYGFKKNCEYDGNKATNFNNMSIKEKRLQHSLEKICLIKYLDEFFENLKMISEFKNFEIIIFSDHDSRIDPSQKENNVIFVHKKKESFKSANIIKEKFSINELFFNLK